MSPLTAAQERAVKDMGCTGFRCQHEIAGPHEVYTKQDIEELVAATWQEAIKAAEACVPRTKPYPGEPDQIWLSGWRNCKKETLTKLAELKHYD